MRTKINFYFIEYALNSILRQKTKNSFIIVVFTALVFLLTSVFFITNAIKYELNSTVNSLPQITLQNIKAGKSYEIDTNIVDEILSIRGVVDVIPRVWGYYYFQNANVNFTVVGIDQYEQQYKQSLQKIVNSADMDAVDTTNSMLIGEGVKKILDKNYYLKYFNFIKPDGEFKQFFIAGIFKSELQLESNDMIIISKENAREIFDIKDTKATDIIIKVANKTEVDTIKTKIQTLFPNLRIITKDDLKLSYANIFDYKSGVFLALFIICLFTFFMIIYDKASGLTSQEKNEIGILKALGWKIDDVLKEKFYEGFIISFISYILGVTLALLFVYLFQAPLLRDIFIGYNDLKPEFVLPFIFDIQSLFLVFFLSVPIYIASTIIPSWRVSTLEADEVMR
jgi:ABC-type lipoprotein release transport system permease subunit